MHAGMEIQVFRVYTHNVCMHVCNVCMHVCNVGMHVCVTIIHTLVLSYTSCIPVTTSLYWKKKKYNYY